MTWLIRHLKNPFERGGSRPLIVHACHHKVGTQWFKNVLRTVSEEYGLRFFSGEQAHMPRGTDVFLQYHSRISEDLLPAFRGSHMIRDPRDVIVSGYFYHLTAAEKWLHRPAPDLDGRSYQEHLKWLDKDAGLLAEIVRQAKTNTLRMTSWPYGNPCFLELRYETVIADEERAFRELFEHYRFAPRAVEKSTALALRFSRRGGKKLSHMRSGIPGEWRNHFTDEHKAEFKRATNDAAVQLGYEQTSNW